jgi:hypothetical protein
MEKREIQSALMALGKHLPAKSKIELSIVGGAAGLLSGELGERRIVWRHVAGGLGNPAD